MIADTAVRDFTERYDEEAIKSIDEMVNDIGVTYRLDKVKSFMMKETFDMFNEYLDGYKQYVLKDKYDIGDKSKEEIINSMKALFKAEGFKDKVLFCKDANKFIKCYIEGCKNIVNKVDNIQSELIQNNATDEEIGNINEYTDVFMESMNNKFNSVMTSLLRESGYITISFFDEKKKEIESKEKVINFI